MSFPNYSLNRCYLCPDGGNWLSDSTLGDHYAGQKSETAITCRTIRGEEFVKSANLAGKIRIVPMTSKQVEESTFSTIIETKLLPANAIIRWLKAKGCTVPQFDYSMEAFIDSPEMRMGPFHMPFFWIIRYRMIRWMSNGWRKIFLNAYPFLLEKAGHFAFNFPRTLPGFILVYKVWRRLNRIKKKYIIHSN